jgi:hypothetical protein
VGEGERIFEAQVEERHVADEADAGDDGHEVEQLEPLLARAAQLERAQQQPHYQRRSNRPGQRGQRAQPASEQRLLFLDGEKRTAGEREKQRVRIHDAEEVPGEGPRGEQPRSERRRLRFPHPPGPAREDVERDHPADERDEHASDPLVEAQRGERANAEWVEREIRDRALLVRVVREVPVVGDVGVPAGVPLGERAHRSELGQISRPACDGSRMQQKLPHRGGEHAGAGPQRNLPGRGLSLDARRHQDHSALGPRRSALS